MHTMEMQHILNKSLNVAGIGVMVFDINFIDERQMKCIHADNFKINANIIRLSPYVGKSIKYVFPNMDIEWLKAEISKWSDEKEAFDIGTIDFKDENKREYKLNIKAMIYQNEKLVLLLQDQSQFNALEKVFSKLTQNLLLKNKTLMHEKEQLKKEIRGVEKHKDKIERFSSVAIHDLKAPLHNIMGFGEIVKYEMQQTPSIPSEFESSINKMIQGAERMNILIEDLLNFSKMKHQNVERQTCHLESIFKKVQQSMEIMIERKQAVITLINLDVMIESFPLPLSIIFQNLLSNALKYSDPTRKPKLVIAAELNDDHIKLSFEDNGLGMSPKQLKHILKPFMREHEGCAEGTGLGMTMVSEAVKRLGAKLFIKSKLGHGTIVNLIIPY